MMISIPEHTTLFDSKRLRIKNEDKQVIAHLYRGEMNRLTVYRQRLDITTNWSITVMSAILVIYLTSNIQLNFIFFPLIILLLFSFLEARRYCYFYTSAKRVELLEIGFFGKQILNDNSSHELYNLSENLLHLSYSIPILRAWMIRFYRNYIWFSYICLLMSVYKLIIIELYFFKELLFIIILGVLYIGLHVILFFQNIHEINF